eukprot:3246632-Amphidinium_carterae.1
MAEHLGFEKTLPRAPVLLAKLDCHMLLACMLALTKEEVRMLEDAELCEGLGLQRSKRVPSESQHFSNSDSRMSTQVTWRHSCGHHGAIFE